MKWLAAFLLSILLVSIIAAFRADLPWPQAWLPWILVGGLATLLGLAVVATGMARYRRGIVVGAVLIAGLGMNVIALGLRAISPARQMAAQLPDLPHDVRCLAGEFTEPSLVFYTHRRWDWSSDEHRLARFAAGPGPRLLLAQKTETPLEGWTLWTVEGLNSARFKWVTLQVAYRSAGAVGAKNLGPADPAQDNRRLEP